MAKDTKSKKGIIGSQPSRNRNVFTHYQKDPNCEVCKKITTPRARCRIKLEKCVAGIALSTKFCDLIMADHKMLNVQNESRCGRQNAPIVQDDRTNWIHSSPMKAKDTSERDKDHHFCAQKPQRIYTDISKAFIKACQDSQLNHDTRGIRRSETNGVAERAVRRVKEGTAVALVQSGLTEWLDCAIACYCYLRHVHDKMVGGRTAVEKLVEDIQKTANE